MCKIRQIDEEGKLRIVAHNGYTMVNFRIKTALNKCTFNISVMTIDRTWIHRSSPDMDNLQGRSDRNTKFSNKRIHSTVQ